MKNKFLALLLAIALALFTIESKAQQDSNPNIRIEKGGTISDISGKNFNMLRTSTYEAVDLPQPSVKAKEFPSNNDKTHKASESDYAHKRTLLNGEFIILEVENNTVRVDTTHYETFSAGIEAAINRTPSWLHEDLRFKFRLITNTTHRTKMVNLLNASPKQYLDEVAFTLAHLPYEVLKDSRFINDWDYLLENVEMIYAFADSLKYVDLVEYGDTTTGNWHTTTKYKIKQGSNYIWREIDKYYYYMFIVMPKLEQEGVYVADNVNSTGQRTWGYGWREYLWFNPSQTKEYTQVNCSTSVDTVTSIPRLGEIMQMPDYLWDESKSWFPFNREFKSTDHAMNVLGNWASQCIPMDVTSSTDYRPSQPNHIAWKHIGNCHEDALLVAAAARTALIPLMHIGDLCDDHVWGMFHDGGDVPWHHFEFFRGGCTPLGDSRQQFWGMTNMQEYGNYGWTSSLVQGYVPDGTVFNVSDCYSDSKPNATLKLKVTDSQGNPVDGARIKLYSTNTQYGTEYIMHAGYLWTDSYGEINEAIGTAKKYYMRIDHSKFGSFPEESGKVYVLINANTKAGNIYSHTFAFSTSPARTNIADNHQEFEANKSVKIDFLAKNITSGVNLLDGQLSTFYDKTETNALLTTYIVDESEIIKFRNNSSLATAEYSFPFMTSGQYDIPLFKTGKTYIVLMNNSNFTNAVDLYYNSDLQFIDSANFDQLSNVETVGAEDITNTSATLVGNAFSNNETIKEQGFQWRKVGDNAWTTTVATLTANPFTISITGLARNARYEYKAYIKTHIEKYGETKIFISRETSVIENISNSDILLFPNPATDQITVSFDNRLKDSWNVVLFDITGKKVKSVQNQYTISTSGLPSGMYFVRIEYQGKFIIKKMIKQ